MIKAGILTLVTRLRDVFLCVFLPLLQQNCGFFSMARAPISTWPIKRIELVFSEWHKHIFFGISGLCRSYHHYSENCCCFFPREEQQLVLHFVEPNQYSVLDFPKPEQEMWLTRPGKRTNWTEAVTAVQDRNAAELWRTRTSLDRKSSIYHQIDCKLID